MSSKNKETSRFCNFGMPIANILGMKTYKADIPPKKREGAGHKRNNSPVTIKGIVIPVDWDEMGNVVAIALSTNDEKEYLIEDKGKGGELKRFLREEIEINGILCYEKEIKMIRVTTYKSHQGVGQTDHRSSRA